MIFLIHPATGRGRNVRNPRRVQDKLKIPSQAPVILRPLAPEVNAVLQLYNREQDCNSSDDTIRSALSHALQNGKILWEHFGRAVVQLNEKIVVKLGPDLRLTESDITDHIQKHSNDVPIPQPLGALSIGNRTYIFMTLITGSPLGKLWPSLSDDEKFSIQDQLNVIMGALRKLPLPSNYLGSGSPPRCIDCRRWRRECPDSIENENQFNAFLLSGNRRSGLEPFIEFVSPMLRNNHQIVLTHGDLHPRNIMVSQEDRSIKVTGLVDWELGGAYPEYWEYVKSLNTMLPVQTGDWVFFLPQKGIGEYHAEFAIDHLIENLVS